MYSRILKGREIMVFGASQSGNKAMLRLQDFGISIVGFVDNSEAKWGTLFSGKKVFSPQSIFEEKEKYLIVIASVYEKEIKEQCMEAGLLEEQVYILDDIIIRLTELFAECFDYLDSIKIQKNPEKTLVITAPNKDGKMTGVSSWMYATGLGLSASKKPFVILTEDMGKYMPKEVIKDIILYNSYAYEKDLGDGIRVRREGYTSQHFFKEVACIIHNILQYLPCTIITSESYGAEYVAASVLKKKFQEYVKVVTVIHSDERARYLRGIWHEKDLDGYLCVSDRSVNVWTEQYKVSEKKVFYHDLPIISKVMEHRYSNRDEPIRIGYLGRLEIKSKRCDLLLKLIDELESRGVNYEFYIAGTGTFKAEIEKNIRAKGLEKKVSLVGFVPYSEVSEFWSDKDIYILISDNEGTSISMLEGMSQGVVPIVTDLACARCFIHEEDGYIVPLQDYREMATKVEWLAYNREKVKDMGEKLKKRILETCDTSKYAEFLLEMQEKLWEESD